jgi:5'-3' exoribonuclease 2
MGVPGFFMWLWKKYKGKNFVFNKDNLDKKKDKKLIEKVQNIDYYLIDTNCMIHPECFKVLDEFNHITNQTKLENKMMDAVIEYLDKTVQYVNPKKGVFIAIDGVAPVAKIKQQRLRRFKSVKDRFLWDSIKKKYGKEIKNKWNNSAITPGTEFMRKLNNKILDWCKKQTLHIIYSSSNSPSEGEHKLLQFIRDNKKEKKNYKYVIYGLDADLLFLGLATGLNDIFLLREAVHLNRNKPTDVLNYVWMEKMRESISDTVIEMFNKKMEINDKILNRNRIINDFIFIGYFLGNDFLPHLPSLDISKNGLDNLLKVYVDILLENNLDYIINVRKKEMINQKVFNNLIEKLADKEDDILSNNYGKKRRSFGSKSNDAYDREIHKIENLMFKIKDPVMLGNETSEKWEKRYFDHYFGAKDEKLNEFREEMGRQYLIGLKWVTLYYFDKCPSWNWYFPYDHPPFLKDVKVASKKFGFDKINFKLGKPIKPFVQLLSVLPPQSAFLLPKKLQKIMNNSNSSLAHLYPVGFKQDFIGKCRYWMGIPYLPELDIQLVIRTFRKYEDKLSVDDKKRNRVIKDYVFNK